MLETAGAGVAAGAVRLRLRLDTPGRFERARVAWIAPGVVPAPLVALQQALRDACAQAGFEVETRPWTPHVTLVRKLPGPRTAHRAVGGAGSAAAASAPAAPGATPAAPVATPATPAPDPPIGFEVRAFVLMQSVSTPEGVEYRPIASFDLPRRA